MTVSRVINASAPVRDDTRARVQQAIRELAYIPNRAARSLVVNSDNVILDDIWAWRADHGNGVGWTTNTADTGVVVNGDDVTAYGLFVEHFPSIFLGEKLGFGKRLGLGQGLESFRLPRLAYGRTGFRLWLDRKNCIALGALDLLSGWQRRRWLAPVPTSGIPTCAAASGSTSSPCSTRWPPHRSARASR